MLYGNNFDLAVHPQAVRVCKRLIPVAVKFASDFGTCETREGDVSFCAGDAILTGVEGEQWPIERPKFDASYAAISPTKSL